MRYIRERELKTKVTIEDKTKIMVIGIGKDVGTTTVSIFLAFYLAQNSIKTSYCQLASRKNLDPYYYLSMDKDDRWKDFYRQSKEGKSVRNTCNLYSGVNWAVCLSETSPSEVSKEIGLKIINGLSGKAIVCDCDYDSERQLLENGDAVIAIIDPMPSKILQNIDKINEIKQMELDGYKVIWVINKMNKGVEISQINKSLKIKDYVTISDFGREGIYKAQFQGRAMIDILATEKNLKDAMGKILQKL